VEYAQLLESTRQPVIIEAALNGGRRSAEHPRIPTTPVAVAREAAACAQLGAHVVHVHAYGPEEDYSADPAWYADAIARIRGLAPDVLVSITSIRPATVPVSVILDGLTQLARQAETRPDLISINLGHIVAWEPAPGGRQTTHYPNDYEDIVALLGLCRTTGIVPELGLMDLGFVSNAVTLRSDGLLPARPWFLIELDSPGYGAGRQVAPSTTTNYAFLAERVRTQFPDANWAAHGSGVSTHSVVRRALHAGAHVRIGFEDTLELPGGGLAFDNASLVRASANAARLAGRRPATPAEARALIGC